MVRPIFFPVRDALLVLGCVAALGSAQAQTVTPAPAAAQAPVPAAAGQDDSVEPGRRNQKIERTRIDDKGVTIDELRYGGQVQNITVTPKGNMPQYEVLPNSSGKSPQGGGDTGTGGTGPAVWNVLKF